MNMNEVSSPFPLPDLLRAVRAIVVVDIVESVRLMQLNESGVIDSWRQFVHAARTRQLVDHEGRMVKSLGDGMLLDFESVRSGLNCARELLVSMASLNAASPGTESIRLRVGIHAAEVAIDSFDIFGSAVNLAARIASLARPDEIVVSAEAADELVAGVDAVLEDLGECFLKHFESPIRAYRILPPEKTPGRIEWISRNAEQPSSSESRRPRLAIFNFGTDGSTVTVSSLVADEIATQLSAHASIELIARMSTRHLHGIDRDTAIERLRANYIVTGNCFDSGRSVHIAVELIFVADRRVVWSEVIRPRLDELVEDPGSTLARLGPGMLAAIEANETGRARSLPLASLDSYALMLGGVRLMHRLSSSDFKRAHAVFSELVARHPRHPDGYAWLAKWHILEVHQGWSKDVRTSSSMARDMARRALDLDDHCALAMIISGMVRMFNDRRLDEAENIYEDLLVEHPNEGLGWLLKGMVHAFRGEGTAAVAHARHASELSPLDPMRYYYDSLWASAEAAAGNFGYAIELALRSLTANAMHASTLRVLTIAYAMNDQVDSARRVATKILKLEPEFTVMRFLERSPSADYSVGRTFAAALRRAGIPE